MTHSEKKKTRASMNDKKVTAAEKKGRRRIG